MKASQAKSICKYWPGPEGVPPKRTPEGKVVCQYLMPDGEMCRRPDRFRCDVEVVKKSRDVVAPADKPVSNTRISKWLSCQRAWALEYAYKARPLVEPEWALVGRIFASCRARIDAGESWEIEPTGLAHAALYKLEGIITEYEKRHAGFKFPPLISEQYVQFEFEGVRFGGYLDAASTDGEMIVEWKYAQDNYDLLKVARQLSVYAHGLPQAKKLVVAVANKSKLREKAKESKEAFRQRILDDFAKDEGLFTFTTFDRSKLHPEMLLHEMVVAYHQSQAALATGEFVPNLGSFICPMCNWQHLCAVHLDKPLGCDGPCQHLDVCEKVKRWNQGRLTGAPHANEAIDKLNQMRALAEKPALPATTQDDDDQIPF